MFSDCVSGSVSTTDESNQLYSLFEVKWAKDGKFVQLGVRDQSNSWIQTLHVGVNPQVTSQTTSRLTNPAVVESLWTMFEDRESINKAIRLLRRARDGAFGRDE